ncbi:MAG: bifunctional transaldolase/phosoglucose isomerase [Candidatus Dormibacteraeota bacterium]|uniref:Transaldolase n=1 Tax=Candidatus Amunia macphersoniae TaxID=3127014 RepID=A0A934KDV3_9BACT|nr:bifunctional transaldolase/phosoglucose isomerase [Candidatus Dormibacteraeota bacterium]
MGESSPLQQLADQGQSVWLDYISRDLITGGELERLIAEDNVTGMTSNPTIFQKAIADGSHYDDQIRELLAAGVDDPNDIFLELAITDIQHAADILRPIHERTNGADGFVSLEVSPDAAHSTDRSIDLALDYWKRVDRPNLMVKIPATPAGIPAIEQALTAGVNINVTLIFALEAYENVIGAYLNALRARQATGESLDVHSVGSFFVSRVDTAVDKMLEEKLAADPANATLEDLLGKAAIANAVLAYEKFESHFRGQAFAELAEAGAHVQRPLWASTSAKNPNYRDVVYAEALVGPDTVDTMPPSTIVALRDHGIVNGPTISADYAGAHRVMDQLASVGIDMDEVTSDLLAAGVTSFTDSYNELIRGIAEKVDSMHRGFGSRVRLDLAASSTTVADVIGTEATQQVGRRLWDRDPDLWKAGDPEHAKIIGNRLGWLDVVETMRDAVPRLIGLTTEVREAGFRNCVLLGMGGSSLCPEVLRTSFGSSAGQPELHVLDTTDPAAIAQLTEQLDPRTTLFTVSSKSGTTLETLSHLAHFWEWIGASGAVEAGDHFICITDPGSPLAETARQRKFRHLFENPQDIGGRYSALSFFGLVPAAIIGIDVEEFLDRAQQMRRQSRPGVPPDLNPGLTLGTVLGLLQRSGRDKVTILAPPRIAAFSLWAEQLIAESTGKEGKGLIPIGDEPIGEPAVYGDDRILTVLRLRDDSDFGSEVAALRAAGIPDVTLQLEDLLDLAAQFFQWEFATAVAGAALGIDPFDEPNVQESKDNTRKVLDTYQASGRLAEESATASGDGISVFGDEGHHDVDSALNEFLSRVRAGDYVAVMAYVTPNNENEAALQRFRAAIRDEHRVATTLGFGPRFLHSTGQLHKGGPDTGLYIQVTTEDAVDVPIPGQPFTFSILKQAQAQGDLQSLRDHGRRVIRLHIEDDLAVGLSRLTDSVIHAATGAR